MFKTKLIIVGFALISLYYAKNYFNNDTIKKSNHREICIGEVISIQKKYNRDNNVYITFKDINNNIVTCEILEKNLVKTNMYITNKKLYAYVNVLDDEDKAINNILYDINKTKYLHSDIMDEELIIK